MTTEDALIEQMAAELYGQRKGYATNFAELPYAAKRLYLNDARAILAIAKPAIEARTMAAYEARVNAIADTMCKNEWPLFGHVDRSTIQAEMRAEVERLQTALGKISRMRVYPDHTINLVTLNAAIHIAEAALEPKEPV